MCDFEKGARIVVAFKEQVLHILDLVEGKDPSQHDTFLYAKNLIELDPEQSAQRLSHQFVKHRKFLDESDAYGFMRSFRTKNEYVRELFQNYCTMWQTCSDEEHQLMAVNLKKLLVLALKYQKHNR
jgi:hypothetical protein